MIAHSESAIISLTTLALLLLFVASGFSQVDANYKATLKTMFEVSGSQETFKAAVAQMSAMFRQNRQIPGAAWAELEAELISTSMDQLVEMLTPVYQKHLTIADLKKVIEFYQTPAGAKFASKNPAIMQESMQVGQEWGMKIGQQLEEKLKSKGY